MTQTFSLKVDDLGFSYPGGPPVLDGASLLVPAGGLSVLIGASGSGKSTLFRLIAGLEMPASGTIRLDEKNLADCPTYLRPLSCLFQEPRLFPHLSVLENVEFGLTGARQRRSQKLTQSEIRQRATGLLQEVGLSSHERSLPEHLSGGQASRVALARALAPRPRLLLLDEPFSDLDPENRKKMMNLLLKSTGAIETTTLMITHHLGEAKPWADALFELKEAQIEPLDNP